MKRSSLALAAMAVVGLMASTVPSSAQYFPFPQQQQQQRYYDPRFDDRYNDYQPYRRRVQAGDVCVTSRGACRTRPAPVSSRCGCNIPGFGFKRGAIEDPRGF